MYSSNPYAAYPPPPPGYAPPPGQPTMAYDFGHTSYAPPPPGPSAYPPPSMYASQPAALPAPGSYYPPPAPSGYYGPGATSYGYPPAPIVAVTPPTIYNAPGAVTGFTNYHVPTGGAQYLLQFKGHRLDRKDVFSQSDPFLVISASKEGFGKVKKNAQKFAKEMNSKKRFDKVRGKWAIVYRSETIRNDQNPTWRPFNISIQTLCRGNLDVPFIIECWDADRSGNHDFIGRATTTIRELQVMRELQLINKRRFGFGTVAGMLEVLQCRPA